jgi:hypothetical protein
MLLRARAPAARSCFRQQAGLQQQVQRQGSRHQLLLRRPTSAVGGRSWALLRRSYADVPGPPAVTNRIVWLVQRHGPREGSEGITIQVMPGDVALPPDMQGDDEIAPLATFDASVDPHEPLAELHSRAAAANVPEKLLPLTFTCEPWNPGGRQGTTTLELIAPCRYASAPPIEHKGVRYHRSGAAVKIALTVRLNGWNTFVPLRPHQLLLSDPSCGLAVHDCSRAKWWRCSVNAAKLIAG